MLPSHEGEADGEARGEGGLLQDGAGLPGRDAEADAGERAGGCAAAHGGVDGVEELRADLEPEEGVPDSILPRWGLRNADQEGLWGRGGGRERG